MALGFLDAELFAEAVLCGEVVVRAAIIGAPEAKAAMVTTLRADKEEVP